AALRADGNRARTSRRREGARTGSAAPGETGLQTDRRTQPRRGRVPGNRAARVTRGGCHGQTGAQEKTKPTISLDLLVSFVVYAESELRGWSDPCPAAARRPRGLRRNSRAADQWRPSSRP